MANQQDIDILAGLSVPAALITFVSGVPWEAIVLGGAAAIIGVSFTKSISFRKGLALMLVGAFFGLVVDIILIDMYNHEPQLAMALTAAIVFALTAFRDALFSAGNKIIGALPEYARKWLGKKTGGDE